MAYKWKKILAFTHTFTLVPGDSLGVEQFNEQK